MRVITWNCNMAFRKKAHFIVSKSPDILIVPECESLEKLKFEHEFDLPNSFLWFGENQNKGLGVFSFGKYELELLPVHNPEIKTVLPIKVSGGAIDFVLLAIWANNPKDKDGAYIEQVFKAIHFYEELLTEETTILMGDFNSNTIWDKKNRFNNHSNVVQKLFDKKIKSVYHFFNGYEQGNEQHHTLYMYRHLNKPYHIDYCFASVDFIQRLKSVEIGDYNDWISLSDHTPLIVDFDI